jgi:hypothetical protein
MLTDPFDHQAKEMKEHGLDKVRAIHWEQGCLDADTEYLSPTGWVPISKYAGGRVAQWHQDTGEAEFVTPSEYVVKDCKEMIRIKTKYGVDQKVSFNHRVPYLTKHGKKPRETSAESMYDDLQKSASAFRHLPSTFVLNHSGVGLHIAEWALRLQVAVMADGHFPKSTPGTNRCVVRLKKERKIARLRHILDEGEVLYYERPSGDFTVFSFEAPRRIKQYPLPWLANMTREQRDIICDEVIHWDGTHRENGRAAYFSKHESDADFMQVVLASQGKITRKVWGHDCWEVHVRKEETPFTIRGNNMTVEPTADGKMYCFCVPTGFLVLRRNGCVFPSGNTGKTRLALESAEELYKAGSIDALFVLAPPGLHTNWIKYEIPPHLEIEHSMIAFQSSKAKTKKHIRECHAILNNDAGTFPILTMSYPGLKTAAGKKLAKQFLTKHRCLFVCDESNRIKTPSAKITRTVLAASDYADYKRTLCGTPITNTPFDIYTQFRFLDKNFWANTPYGLGSFQAFKQMFGIWVKGYNGKTDREFDQCVGFKNLEILSKLVKEMSSRVLKEDVLDLPEKLYSYAGFEMTPKQWRIYKELEDDFMTEINGEFVFTPLAITRLLRLQQVANGYLPTGDENEMHMIEDKNPRLKALEQITQDLPHKTIIWARFIKDIDLIQEMLNSTASKTGCGEAVRWDGTVQEDQREENKYRFKTEPIDKVQFMLATPDSMSEGHTLNEALTTIYYSNSFKMKDRHQSEDRNHRAGQKNHVNYVDIVADNTKDVDIINSLRKKFDNASTVVDGKIRDWLQKYDSATDILS